MYATTEAEELCAWLDRHPEPLAEAHAARRRWLYIGMVADAAVEGRIVDRSLLTIYTSPHLYARKARSMVRALDSWLSTTAERAQPA